jgi:hypothetical protein
MPKYIHVYSSPRVASQTIDKLELILAERSKQIEELDKILKEKYPEDFELREERLAEFEKEFKNHPKYEDKKKITELEIAISESSEYHKERKDAIEKFNSDAVKRIESLFVKPKHVYQSLECEIISRNINNKGRIISSVYYPVTTFNVRCITYNHLSKLVFIGIAVPQGNLIRAYYSGYIKIGEVLRDCVPDSLKKQVENGLLKAGPETEQTTDKIEEIINEKKSTYIGLVPEVPENE